MGHGNGFKSASDRIKYTFRMKQQRGNVLVPLCWDRSLAAGRHSKPRRLFSFSLVPHQAIPHRPRWLENHIRLSFDEFLSSWGFIIIKTPFTKTTPARNTAGQISTDPSSPSGQRWSYYTTLPEQNFIQLLYNHTVWSGVYQKSFNWKIYNACHLFMLYKE